MLYHDSPDQQESRQQNQGQLSAHTMMMLVLVMLLTSALAFMFMMMMCHIFACFYVLGAKVWQKFCNLVAFFPPKVLNYHFLLYLCKQIAIIAPKTINMFNSKDI